MLDVELPVVGIERAVRDREMVAKLVDQDPGDERRSVEEVEADPSRAESSSCSPTRSRPRGRATIVRR
jgi:hypothetical protein